MGVINRNRTETIKENYENEIHEVSRQSNIEVKTYCIDNSWIERTNDGFLVKFRETLE